MTTTKHHTAFAKTVTTALAANKRAGRKPDSVRSLARVMAGGDLTKAETHKRSLFKWFAVSGPAPSTESRALVAGALGIDASALADDDEEESALYAPLLRAVREIVQAELQTALSAEVEA